MIDIAFYLLHSVIQSFLTVFYFHNVGKPKRGIIYTTVCLYIPMIVIFAVSSVGLKFTLGSVIINLLRLACMVCVVLLMYEGTVFKNLIMIAEEYFVLVTGVAIGGTILLLIFGVEYSDVHYVNIMQSAGMLIYNDLGLVLSIILIVLHNRKKEKFSENFHHLIIMCFLLTAHLIFMCLNFHDNGSALSYKTVGVHFIFQSVIIILSISQFNLIKGDNHINLVNKELRYLQMEMQYTYDYYMLANEKYEDISQIRHDINNQIKTIKQLMSDPRSSDEVRKLIEQLENRMSTIKSAHFCENPIVNSVLTAMVQKADSEHIETNILVKNCTELPFENYDICSLFANLCDNAVEACRRIPESSQRFIGIRSSLKGNYFVLKTQNSFCEELKYENKIPKTGKTETGHGYGLKIIKTLQKSIMVNAVLILITEFLRLLWL